MEGFWTLEQWRRVFSTCGRHWPRAAIKKTGDRGDLQWFPPLFTFIAGAVTCNKKKNTSTCFYFIFFFSDLSSLFLHLLFFPSSGGGRL
jgi:hypothetical protein